MPETKTWVEKLIPEYSAEKRELEQYRDKITNKDPYGKDIYAQIDVGLAEDMIGDLNFAINHMRTGRIPGSRRGIDKQGVYKRTALLDKKLFPSLDLEEKEQVLTDEERRKIADILWKMTARERTCYLLHVSYGMSLADIGKELKLSRYTVRTFIDRAKKKIFS